MRISGFTMVKNGWKLYYPIKESIQSILPLVDEFVIALGKGDADDQTLEEIESIQSDKIKIIHTVWDLKKYPNGMENAHQTDIAKSSCTGDWLIYLQADEVVHENDLESIHKRCEELLDDKDVEGLLFNYIHFWGDYQHYLRSHGWYSREIRIIKNDPDIHSWESAQSFRRIPDFDGINYRKQENTFKLKVAQVDASIYHYGFVRPPDYMQNKREALQKIHKDKTAAGDKYKNDPRQFDYGPLGKLRRFKGTHPEVMQEKINSFDWGHALNYSKSGKPNRILFKHERCKYRMLTKIEDLFFGGEEIFAFKNYELLKK